jgi:putative phosphoesterase
LGFELTIETLSNLWHHPLMKFAILADIHGNSAALEAVLKDMRHLGLSEAVNLGDHVSGPLDAHKTAEMLIPLNFPSIRGNHDRWLVEQDPSDMSPSDKVAYDQLEPHHLDWLRAMPATMLVHDEVLMCHATPQNDLDYWLEHVNDDGSISSASLQEIEQKAEGIEASLILCGHTHKPRLIRLSDGRLVLNPGSVGSPGYESDYPVYHEMQTGNPNASYAIAEKSGTEWLITFRSVPYDTERMVEMAKENNRPDWARAVKTGWVAE